MKSIIMMIFSLFVLTALFVLADNEWFDNTNANEYSIYNLSNITADKYCLDTDCIIEWPDGSSTFTGEINATDVINWPVVTPAGNIFLTRVNGSTNIARVFDPEASYYNADNITGGTVSPARLSFTLAQLESIISDTTLAATYMPYSEMYSSITGDAGTATAISIASPLSIIGSAGITTVAENDGLGNSILQISFDGFDPDGTSEIGWFINYLAALDEQVYFEAQGNGDLMIVDGSIGDINLIVNEVTTTEISVNHINMTGTDVVRTFANGCEEISNSTGVYLIC